MRSRRSTLTGGFSILLALVLFPLSLAAQAGQITGAIIDSDGQPVADVQISLEGTSLGTLSNPQGRYLLLNVPPGVYQVNAQRIGFATRRQLNIRVESGGQAVVDFTMTTQVLAMEELVVTGSVSPMEQVKIPFSVGRVSTENMSVPTTHSALASLQGKVAGVSVVRNSGQPGSGVNILLRTPTSVERSNTPMFIVDGVILSSTIGGTTVDLESLDIESVEVVKGAAAASLYGSRAAAGVISITTKRGSNLAVDQTQIKVRSEYGTSQLPRRIPMSNTHNYLQAANGDWLDTDGSVVARNARVPAPDNFMDNQYQSPLYDNYDAVYVPDLFALNTVSVAKNSLSTNFLLSFSSYDERGNIPGNEGFQRKSFRLNVDHRIGDAFTISSSAYHQRSRQDDLDSNPFWDLLIEFEPDIDLTLKDSTGNYAQVPDPTLEVENPLWREIQTEDFDNRTRTLLSTDIRWRPVRGLAINGNVSYDRGHVFNEYFTPVGIPPAPWEENYSTGSMDHYHTQTQTMNGFISGTYTYPIGALTTRTTARAVMERETYDYTAAYVDDLAIGDVKDMDVGIVQSVGSSWQEIRATGYLAQLGLDYDGKYIVDLLGRRDGSSLFGPEGRWNNYYRAAGSWRMAQEAWWPWQSMNEFKVRYAIGTAGGRPGFSDQYETWSVSVDNDGNTSVSKGTLGNNNLRPELTTEQDFGVDMMFNNKYTLQLSYIRQSTEDLIIRVPLAAVAGYSSQRQNTGRQDGTTLEATFQAQLLNTPELSWSMDFVADRSRSKIAEWNRSCFLSGRRNYCEGNGLGQTWGEALYRSMDDLPAHLPRSEFQVNDDGYVVWVGAGNAYTDGVSKNLWGNASYDDETLGVNYQWGLPILVRDSLGLVRKDNIIGRSEPDMQYGWMNNVRWKNLNLHLHFQGQVGGTVYSASRQRMYQHMRHADLDQTGKDDGLKKTIDYYQFIYNRMEESAQFVEDAWFLKLRTASISYAIGPNLIERLGLSGSRITQIDVGLIGRNIWTFTDYGGFDPEAGSVLDRYESVSGYPKMRQLTAYMEVTF